MSEPSSTRKPPARIIFEGVSKAYGASLAVREVSFEIPAGSLVTLLGPSGCGKTTTLRMIAGLELPTVGRILIGAHGDERDVSGLPAAERDVAMVFQSYALFPHMTVLENVAYGLVVSGTAKSAAHASAKTALATVGLQGMEVRLPSELSGGQQQRVAVARALVLEPSVLLFDEPLSNLDAKLRRAMREEIRALQQRLGVTVVYVTHDQEEALAVSDHIIVMNHARIAQIGSPRALYEAPDSVFVATFMGDSSLLETTLSHDDATHGTIHLGGCRLQVAHRDIAAGDVQVSIRPEAFTLRVSSGMPSEDTQPAGVSKDTLPGSLLRAAYLGTHMEYHVQTAVGELFVKSHEVAAVFAVGDAVELLPTGRGITVLAA